MTNRIGPQSSGQAHPTEAPEGYAAHNVKGAPAGKRKPTTRPPVHPALAGAVAEVALIDGPTAASIGQASISEWHDGLRRTERGELRAGEVPLPLPVIRKPRFTRYRLADVLGYWRQRAEQGIDAGAAYRVQQQAVKASRKASEKRQRGRAAAAKA